MKHKSSYCHSFVIDRKKRTTVFIEDFSPHQRALFFGFLFLFIPALHNLKEILKKEEKILLLFLDLCIGNSVGHIFEKSFFNSFTFRGFKLFFQYWQWLLYVHNFLLSIAHGDDLSLSGSTASTDYWFLGLDVLQDLLRFCNEKV